MFNRVIAAALAALFVLIAAPPGAIAQQGGPGAPSEADLEEARKHFMKGRELFEAKDFTGAIDAFKESYRLSRNPLLLYNIGFTLDEVGDQNMALFYYKKFLADAPADAQNRDFVVQRVRTLERESEADAVFSGAGEGEGKGADAARPAGEPVTEFMHNIIEESPPGKPIDVTCFVPDGAGWQVTVSYRAAGEARFTSIDMRQRYNELVGRIPAAVTSGATTVQYYVEARDRTGKVVARSGRSTRPNLIVLTDTAAPRYYPDLTEDRDWEGAGSAAGSSPRAGPRRTGTGDGSFTDTESSKFQYTKWGATGGAVALLGLSVTFYFIAADASSSLEGEAVRSTNPDECARLPSQSPTFPCFTYDVRKKDLESKGRRYQTMSNVTLALGLATAAAAAGLWYWEIRQEGSEESSGGGISAAPVLGPDFVGGAAAVRF